VAIAVAAAALLVAPSAARADDKTIAKIERMNRMAMENYDLLDYEAAKKGLNEALALAKKKRLVKEAVKAETHMFLAIVEFSGFGDQESAMLQLMEAVEIDPKVEIPVAYKTTELQAALDQARAEVATAGGGSDAGAGASGGTVDCSSLMGMEHDLVDEADAGAERAVEAWVAKDVGATKVRLYYRPQGASAFVEASMDLKDACRYVGVIPADSMHGDFLHYYIAAQNKGGKVLASKGSSGSPNIIEIRTEEAGDGFDDGGAAVDDENPLAADEEKRAPPVRKATRSTRTRVTTAVAPGAQDASFFVSLAVGTGGGYVSGKTEQAQNVVGCCFAPALLHVFPEVGVYLSRRTTVSAAIRIGFPVGANLQGHSTGAPSALLRVRHSLAPEGDGLALSGAIGGGIIRHTVTLTDPQNPDEDTDTTASGPFLVGMGAAYTKPLGGPIVFVAELNALLGVPIVEEFSGVNQLSFAVHGDFNLGLIFAF
jgi:hypothetical protein